MSISRAATVSTAESVLHDGVVSEASELAVDRLVWQVHKAKSEVLYVANRSTAAELSLSDADALRSLTLHSLAKLCRVVGSPTVRRRRLTVAVRAHVDALAEV